VQFAKDHQITLIVLGAASRSRWEQIMSGTSVVQRVLRFAGQTGVDVHVIARYGAETPPREVSTPEDA
jgi:K+-sensing histidine kinase KdpD